MALTITLLESTPHRLRYLAVDDGRDTVGFTAGTIPNAAGASPDLRTDSFLGSNTPMNALVSTGVASQDQARTLLDGQALVLPSDIDTPRAHLSITPRQSDVAGWGVDASNSGGFAVILIQAPAVADAEAIIDVTFAHTEDR